LRKRAKAAPALDKSRLSPKGAAKAKSRKSVESLEETKAEPSQPKYY